MKFVMGLAALLCWATLGPAAGPPVARLPLAPEPRRIPVAWVEAVLGEPNRSITVVNTFSDSGGIQYDYPGFTVVFGHRNGDCTRFAVLPVWGR